MLVEGPPDDADALSVVAANLEHYDWVVCASARSVRALTQARGRAWPAATQAAAVGAHTAKAIREAGVEREPVVAEVEGAAALSDALAHRDQWAGRRVLMPTVAGGLTILAERLRAAGARVDEVHAYRMTPRPGALIQADWTRTRPDAVVLASPAAARGLVNAVGVAALGVLRAVVASGPTTSAALAALDIAYTVSPSAVADEVARHLARTRDKFPL